MITLAKLKATIGSVRPDDVVRLNNLMATSSFCGNNEPDFTSRVIEFTFNAMARRRWDVVSSVLNIIGYSWR